MSDGLATAPVGRIDSIIDATGSLRAIELLRIAAGPITLLHLMPLFRDAANGLVYSDRFSQPYGDWYPHLPKMIYLLALWAMIPAAIALSVGLATRVASVYAAGFVAYNLFLSRTHFFHNRAFLVVMLTGIALLPLGRALALDARLRARRGQPRLTSEGLLWPVLLMRFEVIVVFVASGVSKLIDSDWWGGTVTKLRVEQWRDVAAGRGAPDWLLDIVGTSGFHVYFAKVAVLTELAIAVGLLVRRTRIGTVWVAVVFHISIEIIASVEVFSLIAIAALVIWVTPASNDRTVVLTGGSSGARLLSAAVRYLDWTGRFSLNAVPDGALGLTLVDSDGSVEHGAAALRVILSRLPLLFLFVAPFNLAGLRRIWDGRLGNAFERAGDPADLWPVSRR